MLVAGCAAAKGHLGRAGARDELGLAAEHLREARREDLQQQLLRVASTSEWAAVLGRGRGVLGQAGGVPGRAKASQDGGHHQ